VKFLISFKKGTKKTKDENKKGKKKEDKYAGKSEFWITLRKIHKDYHVAFNLYTWSYVIDIGMIIARYFKGFRYYLDIHAFIFTIADFGNIFLISIAIYVKGPPLEGPAMN